MMNTLRITSGMFDLVTSIWKKFVSTMRSVIDDNKKRSDKRVLPLEMGIVGLGRSQAPPLVSTLMAFTLTKLVAVKTTGGETMLIVISDFLEIIVN